MVAFSDRAFALSCTADLSLPSQACNFSLQVALAVQQGCMGYKVWRQRMIRLCRHGQLVPLFVCTRHDRGCWSGHDQGHIWSL